MVPELGSPHEQVQGETQGSMDEVEPKAQEADLTRGAREYSRKLCIYVFFTSPLKTANESSHPEESVTNVRNAEGRLIGTCGRHSH
jgi:hypothetical protein